MTNDVGFALNPDTVIDRPRLPSGLRIYAVADIHGCAHLLENVISGIEADAVAHPTGQTVRVFLGDYIDRGPDSRGVVDRLLAYSRAHPTIFLKGNHEKCLLEFLDNPGLFEQWRRFGASETLKSYGLSPNDRFFTYRSLADKLRQALPSEHLQFFATLQASYVCGDFFFAHAGVRPGVPLAEQKEDDLLWIRDEFLQHEGSFGKFVVHGHTPVPRPELRTNRINIDTGAFATGRLTCLCLEQDEMRFI